MVQVQQQFLSAGPTNWTCPGGITRVLVIGCGGGGGGGSGSTNTAGWAGGAGSTLVTVTVPVVPGTTYNVVVGAGGLNSVGGAASLFQLSLSGTFHVIVNTNTVATTSSQVGIIASGSILVFGTQAGTTYVVSSVTSSTITLTTNYTGSTNVATTCQYILVPCYGGSTSLTVGVTWPAPYMTTLTTSSGGSVNLAYGICGSGGAGGGATNSVGTPGPFSENGNAGGTGGTSGASAGGGGGGGGGGPNGAGGAGGNGATGATTGGAGTAASVNTGAGGGGGGGSATGNAGNGAAGGSGFLYLVWDVG